MSDFMVAFGALVTSVSVGLAWEYIAPVAGVMVGFGTLAAIVVDEVGDRDE